MKKCPNCGTENENNVLTCILCEYDFNNDTEKEDFSNSDCSVPEENSIPAIDNTVPENPDENATIYEELPSIPAAKSNRKAAIIAISVLLIVGIGIGGIMLLNNKGSKSSSSQTKADAGMYNETTNETSTPSNSTTTTNTTNTQQTTETVSTIITTAEPQITEEITTYEETTAAEESTAIVNDPYEGLKKKILYSVDNENFRGKNSHLENAPADMIFYDIGSSLTKLNIASPVLYEGPGETYARIENVPPGDFDIVGENNDWYYLSCYVGNGRFTHRLYGYTSKNQSSSANSASAIEVAKEQVIANFKQTKTYYGSPFYGFYDINGDGIDEIIILYNDVADTSCELYIYNGSSYINQKPDDNKGLWGGISICLDKHYILSHKMGGGEGYDYYELMSDNTLKKIDELSYYVGNYSRNGSAISESEYNSIINTYNSLNWIDLSQKRQDENSDINSTLYYEGDSVRVGIVATDSSGLNMREGPGTNYARKLEIPKGESVTILGENNEWYYVKWTTYAAGANQNIDYYGYVSRQYIR